MAMFFVKTFQTGCVLVKILEQVRVPSPIPSPNSHPCLKLRITPLTALEQASQELTQVTKKSNRQYFYFVQVLNTRGTESGEAEGQLPDLPDNLRS